jgi:hypothetical protein
MSYRPAIAVHPHGSGRIFGLASISGFHLPGFSGMLPTERCLVCAVQQAYLFPSSLLCETLSEQPNMLELRRAL